MEGKIEKLCIIKESVKELYQIKESYRVNIQPLSIYCRRLNGSNLIREFEIVYLTYLINGIYKVIKGTTWGNITLRTVIDDLKQDQGIDLYNYCSNMLEKIELGYEEILLFRSKKVAHLDFDYIALNDDGVLVNRIFEAVDKIYSVLCTILVEYKDDSGFSGLTIVRDDLVKWLISQP